MTRTVLTVELVRRRTQRFTNFRSFLDSHVAAANTYTYFNLQRRRHNHTARAHNALNVQGINSLHRRRHIINFIVTVLTHPAYKGGTKNVTRRIRGRAKVINSYQTTHAYNRVANLRRHILLRNRTVFR